MKHFHGGRLAVVLEKGGEMRHRGTWYQRWLCPACRTVTLISLPLEDEDES